MKLCDPTCRYVVPLRVISTAIWEQSGRIIPFELCDLRHRTRILNLSGTAGGGGGGGGGGCGHGVGGG